MSWVALVIAGLFEVIWAVGLKHTHGFTRPLPTLVTVIALLASLGLLSHATRTIPLGTAYAVWVGIGALGAALAGVWLYGEPTSPARLAFLALLLVSVLGLKATG